MDRVAVFVDAGYLFAQGSTLLIGRKCPRSEIAIDFDKAISALTTFACHVSGAQLLRIYWYDGTSTGPSPQHVALAFKPNLKMRLGFVNTAGQQKGVDSLIVTDMIALARNRAMSDAVLLSGDEDVRVGVQQAQEFGVRVHLLGISPSRGSQSLFLLQEADTTHEWTKNEISPFLSHQTAMPGIPLLVSNVGLPRGISASQAIKTLFELAKQEAQEIDFNLIDGLLKNYEATGLLPSQIDRPLLGKAGKLFGTLYAKQTSELRTAFVSAMKLRTQEKP